MLLKSSAALLLFDGAADKAGWAPSGLLVNGSVLIAVGLIFVAEAGVAG